MHYNTYTVVLIVHDYRSFIETKNRLVVQLLKTRYYIVTISRSFYHNFFKNKFVQL